MFKTSVKERSNVNVIHEWRVMVTELVLWLEPPSLVLNASTFISDTESETKTATNTVVTFQERSPCGPWI